MGIGGLKQRNNNEGGLNKCIPVKHLISLKDEYGEKTDSEQEKITKFQGRRHYGDHILG